MIKTVIIALLSAALTLGASIGAGQLRARQSGEAHHDAEPAKIETRKTRVINVPMIAEGRVQGYIVAQFSYTADGAALKALPTPPDAYLLDEAFRLLYADEKLDFRKLEKFDIAKMTAELRKRVGERMKSDAVRDIMVQEFNYVAMGDVRK
ncbi:MAG: hypothetical protein KGL46_10105 [Hyphomicrobiales bacterium]|nr:hypothetical protein [Hyphomicrobiales bacterium]